MIDAKLVDRILAVERVCDASMACPDELEILAYSYAVCAARARSRSSMSASEFVAEQRRQEEQLDGVLSLIRADPFDLRWRRYFNGTINHFTLYEAADR